MMSNQWEGILYAGICLILASVLIDVLLLFVIGLAFIVVGAIGADRFLCKHESLEEKTIE